ncbi:MAG: hypothetical protein J5535_04585 [Firmicutes bacterium]|nr:hypothetical protein [Bacillota bacterium]MBR5731620.1 hypothetical protein [Bacillota bacterium]
MTEEKNGLVIKTFASRTEYINEDRAYELLRGTGLAPRLEHSFDGRIERRVVEGQLLSDLIRSSAADAPEMMRLFGLFWGWYDAFRKKTGMVLGKVRFESFVLSREGLVCTDFEGCRPGSVEKDIASAAAQLCIKPHPWSEQGMSLAKLFVLCASEKIKYDPETLCQRMASVLKAECREAGIKFDETEAEYLSTVCCMAGLVLAGGKYPVQSAAKGLMTAPERFLSVTNDGADVPGGFEPVRTQLSADDSSGRVAEILRKVSQPWTLVLSTGMPEIPAVLTRALLCAEKDETEAVMVEAGGKVRDFPVLLRTGAAVYDLELGSANGRKTISGALSRRPVRIVKLEDLEVQAPHKEV